MDEPPSRNDALPSLTFQTKAYDGCKENVSNVLCVKCDKTFPFPDHQDDYLAHLFLAHRLVIADVNDIALLEDYLEYWRLEFQSNELEEYCTTMLLDQLPDGKPGKNEKYYLLSDVLPKDYELRVELKKQRMEKVLAQHQFELTDRSFSRECLYCRDVITGLRSGFLEHLYNKHFLQLGKPQNLIYIDELLDKVAKSLDNLVCLYCEKVFKDRMTLKEHMRKKAHKRINPSNKSYDKYYLENYKFPDNNATGKNQRVNAKPANHMTQTPERERTLQERLNNEQRLICSDDSDSDWSDWNGEGVAPLNCLYCTQQLPDVGKFKEHLLTEHKVDFDQEMKNLNFYQKIKVVNYVRRQICLLRCVTCDELFENQPLLLQHLKEAQHFGFGTKMQWDKPEYFFPTYEDDGLLCNLDEGNNDGDGGTDALVQIISEDPVAHINKDVERLSLENFDSM